MINFSAIIILFLAASNVFVLQTSSLCLLGPVIFPIHLILLFSYMISEPVFYKTQVIYSLLLNNLTYLGILS